MLYVRSYKICILVLLFILSGASTYAATLSEEPASIGIKSYHQWKENKISTAKNKVKNLKEKMGLQALIENQDPNLVQKKTIEAGLNSELQSQLEREILNASLTEDLTIADYFVGYLTKQGSLEVAIKDVSTKLTPNEVAELMSEYAKNFSKAYPAALKVAPVADSSR